MSSNWFQLFVVEDDGATLNNSFIEGIVSILVKSYISRNLMKELNTPITILLNVIKCSIHLVKMIVNAQQIPSLKNQKSKWYMLIVLLVKKWFKMFGV